MDLPVRIEVHDSNCLDSTDIFRIQQEYLRSRQTYILVAYDAMGKECLFEGISRYCDLLLDLSLDTRLQTSDNAVLSWEHPESCCACELLKDCGYSLSVCEGISRFLNAKEYTYFFGDTLLNYMENAWMCKSSEPKDLIYAFLSLSPNRFGIWPDYSITISLNDVCSQLARNVMMHYGHLNMLQSCSLPEDTRFSRDPCFPSWVRDYRIIHQDHSGETRWGHRDIPKPEISFSFPLDVYGRKNRVLQAHGVLQSALGNNVECDFFWIRKDPGTNRNFVAGEDWVHVEGRGDAGDEVWFLHGSCIPLLFRKHGRYHEFIGTVRYRGSSRLIMTQRNNQKPRMMINYHKKRVGDLLAEVHELFDEGSRKLQTIKIC
jgi:hypothetical protein